MVGGILGSGQLLTSALGSAPGQLDALENVANSLCKFVYLYKGLFHNRGSWGKR